MSNVTISTPDPALIAALEALFSSRHTIHDWSRIRTDDTWAKPLWAMYAEMTAADIVAARQAKAVAS